MSYLFVHFRETDGVEGEQVYFSVSKDGYTWEIINHGNAVLIADKGDMGVRDIVITRTLDNSFVIMATDLALRRNEATKYHGHIRHAFSEGSKCLAMWKSKDLVNWSDEMLINLSGGKLGCLWAPGIFFDENSGNYIVHWSSSCKDDNYSGLSIYYSCTKDFEIFTEPKLFFRKKDSETLDSCIVKENDVYHFFVKSADTPKAVIHETSNDLFGPYKRDEAFDEQMKALPLKEKYEAPTVFRLNDGKLCLLMDFYGCDRREEQGYVPFVTNSLDNIRLDAAKDKFYFPYGFKHGVVLEINDEEYKRILQKYN
jgi:hypothetical protein